MIFYPSSASQIKKCIVYRTHTIINRGLYTFYPIFHCVLYCRAVSIINLCTILENSLIFEPRGSKLRAVLNQEGIIMAGVWYFLFLGKVCFTSVVILRHILLINYTACRRNVPQSHKYGGPPMNLELGITTTLQGG